MKDAQDRIAIGSAELSAEIGPLGAELQALRDAGGRDLLWDGDPAWWTGRAPLLFPTVGRLAGDRLRVAEGAFPMAQHGFARRRMFAIVEQDAVSARFRLTDDAETRAAYPFAFALDMAFRIVGATLSVTATVTNRDSRPLPFRIGFHPAFRWPLPYGGTREDHVVRFDAAESAPIRRIDADGLLLPDAMPTPVDGDTLRLRDGLFDDGALILDRPAGRGCVYGVPGCPGLRLTWPDMPHLGIWTKPGAGYLCIEPWQGHADAAGDARLFTEGPGTVLLEPGAARDFGMTVEVVAKI